MSNKELPKRDDYHAQCPCLGADLWRQHDELESWVNELNALESMGLVMPSAYYFVGTLHFGIVGLFVFRRGRKGKQSTLLLIGLALMLYPQVVSVTWLLWAVGLGMTDIANWKWNDG